MSVASILQALAENAGQAQLRKGAIYGNLLTSTAAVPGQVLADREQKRRLDAQQAAEQERLTFARNADTRSASDQTMQETAATVAQQRQAINQQAWRVGAQGSGGDVSKFNIKAALDFVAQSPFPELQKDIHDHYLSLQPKLTEFDPTHGTRDETGKVVREPTAKAPSTDGELDARQQFLLSKRASGVGLTPAEDAEVTGYNERKAPTTRTTADQELDAYAKSIGKTKAEDLTYADRQTFQKDKAAITSNAAFQQHMRERQYDNANPVPVKVADQNKLEQEHATRLARALSNRFGTLGSEDAKVAQANHLVALLDQNYDPKTDTYNVPKVQQAELAMGLAKLIAPGGVVAVKTQNEINQRTAKGDVMGALTYALGTPFNGTTQDLVKMYRDSILRQGEVAQTNREAAMEYLRGLAPTELDEGRRKKVEAKSLVPLRQSQILFDAKGSRRLVVSTDGGATWK